MDYAINLDTITVGIVYVKIGDKKAKLYICDIPKILNINVLKDAYKIMAA